MLKPPWYHYYAILLFCTTWTYNNYITVLFFYNKTSCTVVTLAACLVRSQTTVVRTFLATSVEESPVRELCKFESSVDRASLIPAVVRRATILDRALNRPRVARTDVSPAMVHHVKCAVVAIAAALAPVELAAILARVAVDPVSAVVK